MKKNILLLAAFFLSFHAFSQELSVLIDKASPAIFKITAYDIDGNELSSGSGFFYQSTGTGITNYNVLLGASKAKVKTKDGKTYMVSTISSWSKESDMVKFMVKNELGEVFPSLKISPNTPRVGEHVFYLGNNFDSDASVMESNVSTTATDDKIGDILKLSSDVRPAYSGAPVMNMNGEVYGIVGFNKLTGMNTNTIISVKNMNNLEDVNALKFPGKDNSVVINNPVNNPDKLDGHNTMYYASSKVVFCEDVDDSNNPKNESSTFSTGKITVYVDNGDYKFDCNKMDVTYYKVNGSDETEVDHETYTIEPGLVATWWDHTFSTEGEYKVSVRNEYDTWINDGSVTIDNGTSDSYDDPKSTMYYLNSKVRVAEDEDYKNEGTTFYKGSYDKDLVFFVDNDPKNLKTTSLVATYSKKSGDDYKEITTETYTITGKYPIAYFHYTFKDRGDYRIRVVNEYGAWINTSDFTIK